jgi:hypothetical protein
MVVKSSPEGGGSVTPVEVHCTNCQTKSHVHPNDVKRTGGWECHACGQRHA